MATLFSIEQNKSFCTAPTINASFSVAALQIAHSKLLLVCIKEDIVPALSENAAVNIAIAIINALTTLGVLVDPTTKGVGDSDRAMEYTEPWDGDGK